MNPYNVDVSELMKSEEISSSKEILKLKIASRFLKAISKLETQEVLDKTGLHKADLSRLKSMSLERFSIDRLIGIISKLGFVAEIRLIRKKAS